MSFMTVASQMLSLFFIMAVGYVMYRARVIDDAATVRYTRLVLNISLPAQIITSFVENVGVVSNRAVIAVFFLTLLSYAVFAVIAVLFAALVRAPKEERGTYGFMMLFSNVGFMGLPVISTIFGEEALIYAVIVNGVFNIMVYSAGILLISDAKQAYRFRPRLLLNLPLMSTLLSVLLFFAGAKLPETVMTSLRYMGALTTPVAMLILGASIAAMPLKELFGDWRIYVFTIFRLAVVPLAMLALLRLFLAADSVAAGVLVVLAAMPVATNTTMLAIEYGGNRKLASRGIFFSTVLSVITIPLIALLL